MDVVGPLAYRVLIKLSNVADAKGERAWRTKADVAHELGRDQRSIQRAFRELEFAALIKPGDQSFVRHIRADRRPTVYDLNFAYASTVEQPSIEGFTDAENDDSHGETPRGDTVIHSPHGETRGVQTGRQLVSHIEQPINSNNSSTRADHSSDGYSSTTCPTGNGGHVYPRPGLAPAVHCTRCGMHRDQVYNPATFDIAWREVVTA